jgi:DNA-binding NtrC family response regulator
MSNLATTPIVLVVEDEPLVRIVTGEALNEAGFKTLGAANAEEALAILAASIDVRVLVTDVEMPPGANGFELAREVSRRWPAIEILIISARQWPGAGELPSGVAFLEKPVPNEVLISQVKSAADRAAARLEGTDASGVVIPFPKTA